MSESKEETWYFVSRNFGIGSRTERSTRTTTIWSVWRIRSSEMVRTAGPTQNRLPG